MATKPKSTPDKRKKKQNVDLVVSVVLFAMAMIGILGMIHPFDQEPFVTLNDIMVYMLGKWHILLPFIFIIMSVRILLGIKLVRMNTSFVSFIIMFICAPALYHHFVIDIGKELLPPSLVHGGGIWGGGFSLLLHRTIGTIATPIVLGIGCLTAIAILIPWGEMLSSKKRDEEYEEFLRETEEIGARATETPARTKNSSSNAYQKHPFVSQPAAPANHTLPRQDVYRDEEFSSFTEGIKPVNKFKRVLNLGPKNTTYTQEAVKAELENDPVQIPEWEEEPKRSVIMRPAINYGEQTTLPKRNIVEESKNAAPKGMLETAVASLEETKKAEAAAQVEKQASYQAQTTVSKTPLKPVVEPEQPQAAASAVNIKPYSSIINNPYHQDTKQEPVGASVPLFGGVAGEAKASSEKKQPLPAAVETPQEETSRGFVIHRTDEATYNGDPTVNPDEFSPTLDGFTDAAEAVTAAALAEAGVADATSQASPVATAKTNPKQVEAPKAEEQPKAPPKPKYVFPPYDLLALPKKKDTAAGDAEIMQQCSVLEQTLADFRVRAKVVAATRGPAVTQFELQPAPGVKVNSVVNLSDDIALRLAAPGVRMEAPIPGKSAIGIEVPNLKTDPVSFREVVDSDVVRGKSSKLCVGLGKDISGKIITADIAKMPHLLIAGSTGSGKSVCINTIICGILYKALPEEVKLILVDPKVVELSIYDGIPHLLTPVVTEPKKAASALHWAVAEMERRYKLFADNHVRNIDGYNRTVSEKMPYIVIIIDEMADLMACVKADIETAIMRLAAKARAAGIHMILATQRPSVDVITGVLKNNIPSRIAFAVTSLIDSRTILDAAGAEKLLGKGDMLYAPSGSPKPTRVQGAFVSDDEVAKIVEFIIGQSIPTEYSEEVTSVELECDKKAAVPAVEENTEPPSPTEDPLFERALMLVLDTGQASASTMQRRFSIGYNRAARLVDTMAELGVVGKAMGSKPREVIMSRQEAEERFLNKE